MPKETKNMSKQADNKKNASCAWAFQFAVYQKRPKIVENKGGRFKKRAIAGASRGTYPRR